MSNLRLIDKDIKTPVLKDDKLKHQMVEAIALGKATIPEDLVNLFNITYEQSILLLNDPTFLSLIGNYTKAKLNLNFHTKSIPKLLDIVDNGDNKESMQAIKLVAQLSNNLKNTGTDVNINLNLESLVKESEKNINTLNISDYQKVG